MASDADEENLSDVSVDPEFVPYELPDIEQTTQYDLRKVSGTCIFPIVSHVSILYRLLRRCNSITKSFSRITRNFA